MSFRVPSTGACTENVPTGASLVRSSCPVCQEVSPMSRLRRLAVFAAAAALPALGLTLAGQAPAAAAPNFQVPFKCGVTVTAATFSGHSPAYSVDFQKDGLAGMPVLASASGTVPGVAG